MKKFFFALSIFGINVFAQPALESKTFKFSKGIEVKVETGAEAGGDNLEFFDNGKEMNCLYEGDPGFSAFRDISSFTLKGADHPLYVTQWSHGAHGFQLTVLDPFKEKNCVLKTFEAAYTIEYHVEGDHLKVVTSKFNDKQEKIGEEVENWRPEKIKVSRVNNPSVHHSP